MNDAAESSTPFDDVRELAMRDIEPDAACSKKVHEALLGMGLQGDFGKLGQAAEWLAGWRLGGKGLEEKLADLGAEEVADLADLDDEDLAGLGLKKLEAKRMKR